jgi:hypothetical protein
VNLEQSFSIPPFGLDTEDYLTMYGESLPANLTVLIMLAQPFKNTMPSNRLLDLEPSLRRMLGQPAMHPSQFDITAVVQYEFYDNLSVHWHEAFRTAEYGGWMLDCGLVQVGFGDTHLLGKALAPALGVFQAMQIYDAVACKVASTNPAAHQAFPACEECYAAFNHAVGDIYRQRKAIMNRALIEFRNAVSISVRAVLCCEDGIAAYADFKAEDGVYHLQYPNLCE